MIGCWISIEVEPFLEPEIETYVANQGRDIIKAQGQLVSYQLLNFTVTNLNYAIAVPDHIPEVPTVSSLETENLSSWPTSNETTPDQVEYQVQSTPPGCGDCL